MNLVYHHLLPLPPRKHQMKKRAVVISTRNGTPSSNCSRHKMIGIRPYCNLILTQLLMKMMYLVFGFLQTVA